MAIGSGLHPPRMSRRVFLALVNPTQALGFALSAPTRVCAQSLRVGGFGALTGQAGPGLHRNQMDRVVLLIRTLTRTGAP